MSTQSRSADALVSALARMDAQTQSEEMKAVARLEPVQAAELAMGILEGLGTDHGPLVGMACADILSRVGTAAQLDRLTRVRNRLPAFTGLRDWRQDVDHAIEVLTARASGECGCRGVFRGNNAPDEDRFETLESHYEDYQTEMRVRCRTCGREFRVTQDDSYHYPLFSWQ